MNDRMHPHAHDHARPPEPGVGFARCLLANDAFRNSHARMAFWQGEFALPLVQSLFCWRDLNNCLATNRITSDRFRLTTAQGHAHLNARAFRPVRDALGRPTDHVQWHEVHAMLREGVTAVLEAVNELAPAVETMTRTLACATGARSAANAYLSFGETSGFGIHHDDHDVIVIQLHGCKHWQFFQSPDGVSGKATVDELPAPAAGDRGDEVVIREGGVMYLPRGTWHDVSAMQAPSLHLTVSLVHPTLMDFAQWLLQREASGLAILARRDVRPEGVDKTALLEDCRRRVAQAFTEEALRIFCKRHYASHAGHRLLPDFPALHAAAPEDRFFRVPFDVAQVQGDTNATAGEENNTENALRTVYALGRLHQLDALECHLLHTMGGADARTGSALHDSAPEASWERISAALTGLMDKGLAGKQPAAGHAAPPGSRTR